MLAVWPIEIEGIEKGEMLLSPWMAAVTLLEML
jgi:hypothetical protein